jgi:hypothetical protein
LLTRGRFVSIVICHDNGADATPALLDLKTGKIVDPAENTGHSGDGKTQACPYAMSAHFTPPEVSGLWQHRLKRLRAS